MRMFLAVYKCQWMSLIGSPSTLVSNTIQCVGGLGMRLGPCIIQEQGYTGALKPMNTASTLSIACYTHQQLIKTVIRSSPIQITTKFKLPPNSLFGSHRYLYSFVHCKSEDSEVHSGNHVRLKISMNTYPCTETLGRYTGQIWRSLPCTCTH